MDDVLAYSALALSLLATAWCWLRIARSDHVPFFKILLGVIAAFPFLGPLLYLFADWPPKRANDVGSEAHAIRKTSAFLRRWNEREHVYLGWASFVFWTLAVIAYWMNDWQPGAIHESVFHVGHYTDVDVLLFALLVGAVLTFGAALRAKVILLRKIREMSDALPRPTGYKGGTGP